MERIDIHHATAEVLARAAARAAEVLRSGGVIVYPTDTVYGLGADATNEHAVARVVRIKGRDTGKPMLAMVASVEDMERYATVTNLARQLATQYFPGPLSLVLTVKAERFAVPLVKDNATGFRIPDQVFCHLLSQTCTAPITSTSVNLSGQEQPRSLDRMLEQLGERVADIDLVIDAGTLPMSPPSTLVDARHERAVILREGAISRQALEAFL